MKWLAGALSLCVLSAFAEVKVPRPNLLWEMLSPGHYQGTAIDGEAPRPCDVRIERAVFNNLLSVSLMTSSKLGRLKVVRSFNAFFTPHLSKTEFLKQVIKNASYTSLVGYVETRPSYTDNLTAVRFPEKKSTWEFLFTQGRSPHLLGVNFEIRFGGNHETLQCIDMVKLP